MSGMNFGNDAAARGRDPSRVSTLSAAPTAPAAPATSTREAHTVPLYWFWIGHGHTATIRATTEDEARAAILARYPHARAQRLTIAAWED